MPLKLKEKLKQLYNYSIVILIMPLLFFQVIWARFTVLRLQEPCGERSGLCGGGATLRLLIIGDSVAAGVGVADQKEALAGQLTTSLALKYKVNWNVIARTGYTSADIIKELTTLSAQSFDYVLISVGVNDVTNATRSSH